MYKACTADYCQCIFLQCLQSNWSNIVEKHASHASQLQWVVACSAEYASVPHLRFFAFFYQKLKINVDHSVIVLMLVRMVKLLYLRRYYITSSPFTLQGSTYSLLVHHLYVVIVICHWFIVFCTETVCMKKNDSKCEVDMANIADSISMEVVGKDHPNKGQQLSDLAVFLLRSEVWIDKSKIIVVRCCIFFFQIQQILLLSIVAPIAWLDGYTARKCINLATLVFEKVDR